MMRSILEVRAWGGLVAALLLLAAPMARADAADEADAAEALASASYFDSFPYEEARALSDAGVARLIELLEDPSASEAHPGAIFALGVSGRAGAFEALSSFASHEPQGKVSNAVYRSRVALRFAMGHLARRDDRALAYLMDAFQRPPARASWRYSVLNEERVARKLRRDAASGLATSGRPEAGAALAAAIGNGAITASPSEFAAHLASVLEFHQLAERDEADAVLGGGR